MEEGLTKTEMSLYAMKNAIEHIAKTLEENQQEIKKLRENLVDIQTKQNWNLGKIAKILDEKR